MSATHEGRAPAPCCGKKRFSRHSLGPEAVLHSEGFNSKKAVKEQGTKVNRRLAGAGAEDGRGARARKRRSLLKQKEGHFGPTAVALLHQHGSGGLRKERESDCRSGRGVVLKEPGGVEDWRRRLGLVRTGRDGTKNTVRMRADVATLELGFFQALAPVVIAGRGQACGDGRGSRRGLPAVVAEGRRRRGGKNGAVSCAIGRAVYLRQALPRLDLEWRYGERRDVSEGGRFRDRLGGKYGDDGGLIRGQGNDSAPTSDRLGFSAKYARDKRIPVGGARGRGSGWGRDGGLYLAWPLQRRTRSNTNLLFERFIGGHGAATRCRMDIEPSTFARYGAAGQVQRLGFWQRGDVEYEVAEKKNNNGARGGRSSTFRHAGGERAGVQDVGRVMGVALAEEIDKLEHKASSPAFCRP